MKGNILEPSGYNSELSFPLQVPEVEQRIENPEYDIGFFNYDRILIPEFPFTIEF